MNILTFINIDFKKGMNSKMELTKKQIKNKINRKCF